jgi:hypothetical protein
LGKWSDQPDRGILNSTVINSIKSEQKSRRNLQPSALGRVSHGYNSQLRTPATAVWRRVPGHSGPDISTFGGDLPSQAGGVLFDEAVATELPEVGIQMRP